MSREYKRWLSSHFPPWACREVVHLSVQGRHCESKKQRCWDHLIRERLTSCSAAGRYCCNSGTAGLAAVSLWDPPLHSLYCTLAVWGLTPEISVPARLPCWNPGPLLSTDQHCSPSCWVQAWAHRPCGTTISGCPQSRAECCSTKHYLALSKEEVNSFQACSWSCSLLLCRVLVHTHHSGISHFNYKTYM